jgi:hypothetical protein
MPKANPEKRRRLPECRLYAIPGNWRISLRPGGEELEVWIINNDSEWEFTGALPLTLDNLSEFITALVARYNWQVERLNTTIPPPLKALEKIPDASICAAEVGNG